MEKSMAFLYGELLPFIAMLAAVCSDVGTTTIFKAATEQGLSYHVFMFYSYAISTLLLLPFATFFHRKLTELPPVNGSLVFRFFLLGAMAFTVQLMGYKGIEYASPTLGSAMSNLVPASTFVLAIFFRMEKFKLTKLTSQAKLVGTIVSLIGAIVVVLYKGKTVIKSSISLPTPPPSSPQLNWVLGGCLLAASYILASFWIILQTKTIKEYPAEFLVVLFFNLSCTIVSGLVGLIEEPNLSSWKLKPDIGLVAILYSGILGVAFGVTVHTWGLRLKGPVYVAMFKPLSIAVAAFMGVSFLGDSLYLGSIIGAAIISVGFYIVMWGKSRENRCKDQQVYIHSESPLSTGNAPLLKAHPTTEEHATHAIV